VDLNAVEVDLYEPEVDFDGLEADLNAVEVDFDGLEVDFDGLEIDFDGLGSPPGQVPLPGRRVHGPPPAVLSYRLTSNHFGTASTLPGERC
jgi:hypothetical protein